MKNINIMKTIKFLFIPAAIFTIAVILSSCKKNLEEHPFSTQAIDQVFNSETGLKEATLGIYQTYTEVWETTWYRFGAAETGQRYAAPGQFGDGFFNFYNEFTNTPTSGANAQLDAIWAQDYKIISRANIVIANASTAVSDSSVANIYIAEARALRGFAYFDLVRNFGGVPIIEEQISSLEQTDLIYASRATPEACYNLIISDLLYGIAELPDKWTGSDLGRVSSGIAKALLGKVYLTMAGKPYNGGSEYYQKAISVLSEIVGSANEANYGFGLMDNYSDIFANSNKLNKEILLVFTNYYASNHTMGSIWPFFLGARGLVNNDEQSQSGLTYKFYQLFENTDTRRDFTAVRAYVAAAAADVASAGDSIIYDQKRLRYIDSTNHKVFGNATINQGIVYGKFDRTPRETGVVPWGYPIDMVQIRFSDVLLMLAEAYIETGKNSEALPLINRVRTRAHATPYTDQANMEARVRLERRLELTGEFNTVYDIRRWGTLQSEIAAEVPSQNINNVVGKYSPKLELYPIPQSEIDVNPNLTQNPGW